jgi:signal transduction histidine kinase
VRPPQPGPVSDRAVFWERTRRGWDVVFYGMVALGVLALWVQRPESGRGLAAGLAALGVLVLAYAVLGRRAVRAGDRVAAALYLTVMIGVVGVVVATNPVGTLLLFIAYSQIWFFAETRRVGVVLCVVLTAVVFGALALTVGARGGAELQALASQAVMALVFAVMLGLWVTQVAERSEERADLLAQLEAAQSELARSHHAAGVTAERERMAREIHDTLAQGFTSVVMLSQTAAADLRRGDTAAAADRVLLAEQVARDNLAEARALVAAFAPVPLEGATLGEALERLAQRFAAETGTRVEVALPDDDVPLTRETEVVLLRAAQESLTNVRRHAGARRVGLALEADATTVRLLVTDDGRGIPEGVTEGFGLRGMRDRVASVGGTTAVRGPDTGGTQVAVSLPLVPGAPSSGGTTATDTSADRPAVGRG